MTKNHSKFHYAWIILIGLSIIVGIGKAVVNNSAGLFLPSVTNDLGIGMGRLTLYFSVSAVVTMIFLPFGGKLMAKYDTRYIIVSGILLQAGAFALFGLMSNVWGWYVLAIPLAMGGVFITVIVGPVVINQWFKTRNGLALGILSASGGLFGAISQPIAAGLISGLGWRIAYIALGVAVIIIIVPVALFLIKRSPKAHGVQPYGAAESNDDSIDGAEQTEEQEEGIEVAVAKKSSALYFLMLFFFFVTSIASFSMHIPKYLENIGFGITFSGNVMSAYMIGILIGSLILGYLVDKLGSKNTAIGTMITGILAIGTLIAADDSTILIIIAVGIFGLVSSSIGIIAPALTTSLFGKRNYSQIYATASMGLAISSIIALPAYGFVYDAFNSYIPVLYAIIIMLALNIAGVWLAFANKNKLVSEGHWKK